jgi:hypothetical protein
MQEMYRETQIPDGYKVGITGMTGGWSANIDSGKGSKLHFFQKDVGKSICGMVNVTEKKVKHKFIIDHINTYRDSKICKLCVFRKEMEWTE